MKGLEALTGSSNFDICEYIINNLIVYYRNTEANFSMLCKTSVARKIFSDIVDQKISFDFCEIFEFDAKMMLKNFWNKCECLFALHKID